MRGKRRSGPTAAAIVALLVTWLAATPPADAAVPSGFVGLQGCADPRPNDFVRVARAGVKIWRTNLLWSQVEARRGTYDWSVPDATFTAAAGSGVRLLPVVIGSPPWASRRVPWQPRNAAGRRAFYRFVSAAVARYGPRGSFWDAQPQRRRLAPRYWQAWNEPNHPYFWLRPNARAYVTLLKGAARAARAADSRVRIVLAGLPNTRQASQEAFLRAIYRVRGARSAFDVVALHRFAGPAGLVRSAISRARAVMGRHGDSRTPIWITEVGWATGGPPKKGFITSQRGQARKMRETFRLLLRERRAWRILGAVWYCYRDPELAFGQPDWWGAHAGVRGLDDRPKRAWSTLVRLAGGRD